ncbi:MAG: enoyl-CoA hydratase/isomerase family protein [Planctomycetes bacterium]|nr:enoyl-CoA hydratase/isomerase family protein [Planctomycetota bacterium]
MNAARVDVEGPLAIVTFDVPDRDVNVFTEAALVSLTDTIVAASDRPGVRAVVVRSAKKANFCAGADVESIASVTSQAEGQRLARLGQQSFQRIERLAKPVVAAVHGACVGGGLEFALACHGLIVSHDPKTKLGLPETQLGIVPGFGGTQRLPHRVGVPVALDMILTGRLIKARAAERMGLADDCVCPYQIEREAKRYALELADGKPRRNAKRRRGALRLLGRIGFVRRFMLSRAKAAVLARTAGVYPAPLRALALVDLAFSADREAAFVAEATAVGDLLAGDVAHRLVDLFLLMERLKRRGAEGRGLRSGDLVGVVGAGVMGAGIAKAFLDRGARVRLVDVTPDALGRGTRAIAAQSAKDVSRRRATANEARATLDRLETDTEIRGLEAARVVVEAVAEKIEIKRQVFAKLERACPEQALLASNTSSLPLATIGAELGSRGRVVGLHFFNPVERMPLVEIVRSPTTSEATVVEACAIVRDLGKYPVCVKDLPGFAVNRVLAPYLAEALLLVEEGVDLDVIDDAMRRLGFPMGPIRVLDTVGLDVATAVADSLKPTLGARLAEPRIGRELAAMGHLGDKSRGGFRVRRGKGSVAAPWLADALTRAGAVARSPKPDADEIRDRLWYALLCEAAFALEDGIVDEPAHLDAALVLGAGFPPAHGGPVAVIESLGRAAVVARLEALHQRFAPRFQTSAWLRG